MGKFPHSPSTRSKTQKPNLVTGKSRCRQKRSVTCNKTQNIPFCRAAGAEVTFRSVVAVDATVAGCGSAIPYRGGLARAAESADIRTTAADAVAVAAAAVNIASAAIGGRDGSANGTCCGRRVMTIVVPVGGRRIRSAASENPNTACVIFGDEMLTPVGPRRLLYADRRPRRDNAF